MPHPLPAAEAVLRIIFILFLLSFLVQNLYYWILFSRRAWYRRKSAESHSRGVSVVICARNEYHRLRENLPVVLQQDHPDFEVVVVNNSSDDDSSFLLTKMAEQYPNLKIVEIKENLNFFSGKKFPLSIGIKSASKEIILLTDADCRPVGKDWISRMEQSFDNSTGIVLGYGGYADRPGMLNRVIRFDTAHIAMQYLSYCISGIPYMGVGRNMAYLKTLFYENKGFTSHYQISSGDDDLFINRVANRKNAKICIDPESFIYSDPKTGFGEWFRQKKRHLSTGRYYRPFHRFLLGSYIASQLLFYLFFMVLFSINFYFYIVIIIFAIRLICQMVVFRQAFRRLREKDLWLLTILFEPFLLVINTALFVSNLFVKTERWK